MGRIGIGYGPVSVADSKDCDRRVQFVVEERAFDPRFRLPADTGRQDIVLKVNIRLGDKNVGIARVKCDVLVNIPDNAAVRREFILRLGALGPVARCRKNITRLGREVAQPTSRDNSEIVGKFDPGRTVKPGLLGSGLTNVRYRIDKGLTPIKVWGEKVLG